jgi:hypothetical protein
MLKTRIEPMTLWSLEDYNMYYYFSFLVMRVIISLYYALCTNFVQSAW